MTAPLEYFCLRCMFYRGVLEEYLNTALYIVTGFWKNDSNRTLEVSR